MAEEKRILIIGAGVIGLSAAYYCALRGHRVTVLDRAPETHEGCSYGNAGLIVPSHMVPLAAPGMVARGLKMLWNPESPFYVKPRLSWELIDWCFRFVRAANREHVTRSAPLLRDLHLASRACFEKLEDERGCFDGDPRQRRSLNAVRGRGAGEGAQGPSGRADAASRTEGSKPEVWQRLPTPAAAGSTKGFGLVKNGLLMLCRTHHALDEEAKAAKRAKSLGVPAQVLDAKQTAALDPGVRMDVAGAIFFPKDCHLSPSRFMAFLKARCLELGITFRWDTEVTCLSPQGSSIAAAVTADESIPADEFILCGGSWSPSLARSLGLRMPMQAGKGHSLTLAKPRQLPLCAHILTEARVAVTPMGDSLRFGGTMEIAGLNEAINSVRVQGIIRSSLNYYPDLVADDFRGVKPWCGLRPCPPDGLPYLGRTARFTNLTLATGHAMMGLSLGPITGRLVAEIVSGERPAFDLSLLSPDRFA